MRNKRAAAGDRVVGNSPLLVLDGGSEPCIVRLVALTPSCTGCVPSKRYFYLKLSL